MLTVDACTVLAARGNEDPRGSLAFVEAGRDTPFPIARVFYLYGIPEGASRGGHAHRALHQGFIAIAGRFDVCLDDGAGKRVVHLSSPRQLLHVPPSIWVDLRQFSPGAVCLALASHAYEEADYIREYATFTAHRRDAR